MQFTSVNVLCGNVYYITLTTKIKLDKTGYRLCDFRGLVLVRYEPNKNFSKGCTMACVFCVRLYDEASLMIDLQLTVNHYPLLL